jgi:hypothetical protein
MKRLLLISLLFTSCFNQGFGQHKLVEKSKILSSQEVIIKPFKIKSSQSKYATSSFAEGLNYSEFELDTKELAKIGNSTNDFKLEILLSGNKQILLNLSRIDILGKEFKVKDGNGNILNLPTGHFFHGIVENDPSKRIAVSVYNDAIDVLLETSKGKYNLRKALESNLYEFDDIISTEENFCPINKEIKHDESKFEVNATNNCKTLKLYVAADYAFYTYYGNNPTYALQRITTVINQMNLPFQLAQVGIQLSGTTIFTSAAPFIYSDMEALLNSFNYWYRGNSNVPPSNFGQLFTTYSSGSVIGLAYLNENVCYRNPNPYYPYTYSSWAQVTSSISYLTAAHEIGHTMGSNHTNNNSIMDPFLNSSNNTFDTPSSNLYRSALNQCGFVNNDFPLNKNVVNLTSTSARLTWNRTSSGTDYTLHYRKVGDATFSTVAVSTAIIYNLTGLLPNTQYEWSVTSDCSPTTGYSTQFFTTISNLCYQNSITIPFQSLGSHPSNETYWAGLYTSAGAFVVYLGFVSNANEITVSIPTSVAAGIGYKIIIDNYAGTVLSNQSPPLTISSTCVSPCTTALTLASTTDDISSGTITKEANATTGTITATNKISGTANVTYRAGRSITLDTGFKADNGTVFKTEFGGCN